MKHFHSKGEYDTQLLAELTLESCMGDKVNGKFFDMWKHMLKEKTRVDLGQITIPQLRKELKTKVGDDIDVVITGIKTSIYKIRVWKPHYTLITVLEE